MDMNNDQELPQPPVRESEIGIAAFISGGLSLCVLLSYLMFIFVKLKIGTYWNLPIPLFLLATCSCGGLLGLIGFILGTAALFQKNQKKVFAILAIVEAILVILLMAASFFTLFFFTGG